MPSRKTRARFGGFDGSRNASDRETSISDGTVRPALGERHLALRSRVRTRRSVHAAFFRSEAEVMQYASEWRIPAGSFQRGSGATSQSNVGDRPEERRRAARRQEHRQPAVGEARLVVLRLYLHVARDHPVRQPQVEELRGAPRCALGVVEREACRLLRRRPRARPPFDQTNGATRISDGSTPSP